MLGVKPITLADSTVYISHNDPGIDWDKVADLEYEKPETRAQVDKKLEEILRQDPAMDKVLARRHVTTSVFASNTTVEIWKNPSLTTRLYIPKDGERLTRFVLGVIPRSELARIHDECKDRKEELHWRCFLHGLRNIENWGSSAKIPTTDVNGTQYVDRQWLKDTFVRTLGPIADEVGRIIWAWNNFGDDDAKK